MVLTLLDGLDNPVVNGDDVFYADSGDDVIFAGSGDDTIFGQDNADTVWGGDGNDVLDGGNNFDTLNGEAGNDILRGDSGSDNLNGGDGNDTLTGGTLDDNFVFNTALGDTNVDTITDFTNGATGVNNDRFSLENAVFTGLGQRADGIDCLRANGTGPQDANDRLIYNSSDGELYYDADAQRCRCCGTVRPAQAGVSLTNATSSSSDLQESGRSTVSIIPVRTGPVPFAGPVFSCAYLRS